MAKIIIRGQTVEVHKTEEKEFKDPSKSNSKLKVIYFTVADRDRHPAKGGGYETDGFYFCKVIGELANTFEKFCGGRDKSGKLISRKLYLEAQPMQYTKKDKKVVKMDVPSDKVLSALGIDKDMVPKRTINLEKTEEFKYTNFIFEIKEMRFDDYVDVEGKDAPEEEAVVIKIGLGASSEQHYAVHKEPEKSAPKTVETEKPKAQELPKDDYDDEFDVPVLPDVFGDADVSKCLFM